MLPLILAACGYLVGELMLEHVQYSQRLEIRRREAEKAHEESIQNHDSPKDSTP